MVLAHEAVLSEGVDTHKPKPQAPMMNVNLNNRLVIED